MTTGIPGGAGQPFIFGGGVAEQQRGDPFGGAGLVERGDDFGLNTEVTAAVVIAASHVRGVDEEIAPGRRQLLPVLVKAQVKANAQTDFPAVDVDC